MADLKTCSKCGVSKEDIPDIFRHKKGRKSSESACRDCERAYARKQGKAYYKNNKEKVDKRNKEWNEKNKEKMKEYMKEYHAQRYLDKKDELMEKQRQYRKDNERFKQHAREYYQKNKEWINKRNKMWREANRDKVAETVRKWWKRNKNKRREYNQTRRAKVRELVADLTVEQWELIQEYFNHCCAYCGEEKALTQDHFIPVSSGGGYTVTNIVPACLSCNSSKHDNDFFEWYSNHENYTEERVEKLYQFFEDVKVLGK